MLHDVAQGRIAASDTESGTIDNAHMVKLSTYVRFSDQDKGVGKLLLRHENTKKLGKQSP